MTDCMLSTADNPYNPFEEFDKWFQYDLLKGYNTCGYLARIANVPDEFSDEEESLQIENAIDEILEIGNPVIQHIKIIRVKQEDNNEVINKYLRIPSKSSMLINKN